MSYFLKREKVEHLPTPSSQRTRAAQASGPRAERPLGVRLAFPELTSREGGHLQAGRRQPSSFSVHDSFIPHTNPVRSDDDRPHFADEGTKAQSGVKRCPSGTNRGDSGPARRDRKRGPADTPRATTPGRGEGAAPTTPRGTVIWPRPLCAQGEAAGEQTPGAHPGAPEHVKDTHGEDLPLQRLRAHLPPGALQQLPQPVHPHDGPGDSRGRGRARPSIPVLPQPAPPPGPAGLPLLPPGEGGH